MIITTTHADATRTVSYFGRVLGFYAAVRYRRTGSRAWRCVTVLGALGYAKNERDARRWLMEMVP